MGQVILLMPVVEEKCWVAIAECVYFSVIGYPIMQTGLQLIREPRAR